MTPQTDVFTLKSNEERQVVFAITAPKTAAAGGHYLGVGVEKNWQRERRDKIIQPVAIGLVAPGSRHCHENLQITEWIGNNKIFLGKNWQFNLALLIRAT